MYYPEFFPSMFILCSGAVLISYFQVNYQYLFFVVLLSISFLTGKFWISNYYFEKSFLESNLSKSDSLIGKIQFHTLDSQLVTLNPANYKVSIFEFSFYNCLPCRQLNPEFDKWCKEYNSNPSVLIAKINPIESIAYLKAITDSEHVHNTYSDLYTKNAASARFNAHRYPVTIILDAKGRQVYRFDGYWPGSKEKRENEFKRCVDSILSTQ